MSEPMLTAEQEAEALRIAEIIGKKAQKEALRIARLLASKPDRQLLGRTEFEVRDIVHSLGATALETALAERKKGVSRLQHRLPRLQRSVEKCELSHEDLAEPAWPGSHPSRLLSLPFVRRRALPLGSGVGADGAGEEVVALAGGCVSFQQASTRLLVKLDGVHLSETTVEVTTEVAGQRAGKRLADGQVFGAAKPWAWNRDVHGNGCAYVSLDATGVPMQGENGGRADGRMAYVAMIYNPVPTEPPRIADRHGGARYLAGFYEETAGQQHARWRHRLKHEGGVALTAELEALEMTGRSTEAKEAHRIETAYFRKNVHRMDYPTYVAKGWQIGSGPVESACKMVVNQRLCMGGMRWGDDGADSMCHLRALIRSEPEQWDAFWNRENEPENYLF